MAEAEAEAEAAAWLMTSGGRQVGLGQRCQQLWRAATITSAQLIETAEMCSRAGVSQQQQHSRAMTLTVAVDVAGLEMQLATAEDTALAVALGPAEQKAGLSTTVIVFCLQAGSV